MIDQRPLVLMTDGEEVIPFPASEIVPAGLRDIVEEVPGQP
jgi:hypothetical protein